MSAIAPELLRPGRDRHDDVPIDLVSKPRRSDRVFDGILAGSSALSLLLMVAVVVFLFGYGYDAFRAAHFGIGLFTDPSWSPDSGHFGISALLVGSIAIAVVSVAIAAPISIALALMINEYAPRQLKGVLTAIVDLLATVPSIVYGFWGLLIVSNIQAPPAKWIVDHLGFVPIFRTPTPDQYVKSVFAVSLICAVTIIPIITSISREVMAQAPRDVCEASLALGGTRWAMVTDVILPFSKGGILAAILLGIGRGLGETMIVFLVLSSQNHLTEAIMGPNGLGSIADEITTQFASSSPIYKSALVLTGLVLFLTTLVINVVARLVVQRSGSGTV